MTDLETHVMEMCGERDRFRKSDIQIAPLQICTHTNNIDKMERSGNFHYRNDITKYVHKKTSGDISHTDLFVKAKKIC